LAESEENATIARAGETVKASLRKALADSHVAAIAIALLLAWSSMEAVEGCALPVGYGIVDAIGFLLNAVIDREIPHFSPRLDTFDLWFLSRSLPHLETAATCAIAAWLLARWVYGQGPIRCLRTAWSELPRRSNASSIENSACR